MKYLSVILIIIFSFALVQVQARHLKHLYNWGHYNSDDSPPSDQYYLDWMSRVPNQMPVSMLSIPGTHDSGTFLGHGGDIAQCQSWNIYNQLRAGIRFFDIRFDYATYIFNIPFYSNQVGIYHGISHQIDLKSQLQSMMTFLTQHPKEFIIMLLAQENGHNEAQSLNRIMGLFESLKFPYYMSKQIPKVGQLRGKVWIMLNSASFPGMSQNTFVFQNKQTLYFQFPKYFLNNEWEESVDQKVKYTKQLISKQCVSNKLKFNWLNKAYNGRFPYEFARQNGGTNESIERYLKDREENIRSNPGQYERFCVGILVMDFPGTNLIRLIINNNMFI